MELLFNYVIGGGGHMYGHRVKQQCKEKYGSTTMVGKKKRKNMTTTSKQKKGGWE